MDNRGFDANYDLAIDRLILSILPRFAGVLLFIKDSFLLFFQEILSGIRIHSDSVFRMIRFNLR